MAIDYSKLKGRIVEKYATQSNFSKAINLSERTLSLKLNGEIDWKQSEILKAMKLLDISNNEVNQYFFTLKVQNI
jgi:hypothetical protein